MAKVTMPQLGESVAEGTIGKWLKQPGDHVDKYEPLVEVITDKVNAEVPSPYAGTLTEILVEEGATVPNNAEIAVIEEAGATDAAAAAAPAAPGDSGEVAEELHAMKSPSATGDLAGVGRWVEVTGHYDDPISPTCRYTGYDGSIGLEPEPPRAMAVVVCRLQFVVTDLRTTR